MPASKDICQARIAVKTVGPECLRAYAAVPIRFWVRSYFDVQFLDQPGQDGGQDVARQSLGGSGLGGLALVERKVEPPYLKDYDLDDRVAGWAEQFDVSRWGFFLAMSAGGEGGASAPLGAVTVAFDTPSVRMLDGRRDLAVLWDIRVQPEARGQGVGAALFGAAAEWARERDCTQLKVETQNINVPACRFYARMGCKLGAVHRHAYAAVQAVSHEVMLLWYLDL
jgi:GNAT superfamily N-acetyltransferase